MQDKPKTESEGGHPSLKERAVDELKKYAVITFYLWVLFFVFGAYRRMLLHENGVNVLTESFAIVNALIFGKVILIADALNFGHRLRGGALATVVLGRSLMFSALLILFHIAEEAIRAAIKGQPLGSALDDFGGGTWPGVLTYGAIFFVALIPFFAFQEVSRVLGSDLLWRLFFTPGTKPLKQIREGV
jgi:hypothetical protein